MRHSLVREHKDTLHIAHVPEIAVTTVTFGFVWFGVVLSCFWAGPVVCPVLGPVWGPVWGPCFSPMCCSYSCVPLWAVLSLFLKSINLALDKFYIKWESSKKLKVNINSKFPLKTMKWLQAALETTVPSCALGVCKSATKSEHMFGRAALWCQLRVTNNI